MSVIITHTSLSRSLPAVVLRMRNSEWSVALSASDMPSTGLAHYSPEQLAEWVSQGVDRLGGEVETWYLDRHTGRLFHDDSPEARAEWKAFWGGRRRFDTALGQAFSLMRALDLAGVKRSFPTVPMPIDTEDGIIHFSVPERDVEMARRRAALLAAA
ncbi:hypothetical protein ACIBCT_40420 [Streptosporangium sp. NPDC050855]|uniref:hypothetical protein n=1 Tax=Streptosporangium sp. NPDC050855 TaxID=3366194 RepID=UPI0037B46E12